jgi:hypothetical protein
MKLRTGRTIAIVVVTIAIAGEKFDHTIDQNVQEIRFLPGIEQLQRGREDLQKGLPQKSAHAARDPSKQITARQQFPVFQQRARNVPPN